MRRLGVALTWEEERGRGVVRVCGARGGEAHLHQQLVEGLARVKGTVGGRAWVTSRVLGRGRGGGWGWGWARACATAERGSAMRSSGSRWQKTWGGLGVRGRERGGATATARVRARSGLEL